MVDNVHYGALDSLVKQFSSAFDCLRELVQNAIDAGTTRVDVWTEFTPGDGHLGTIALHVDDYGEGMNEKIIDEELTRLFASSKEGDLTKIGKFGIGFVSVFALEPRAVLVVTGRGGEHWEVLFHQDRTFTKTKIDTPVEGTQVTLFLEGDLHRYRELVASSRAALEKWCSHSETEVSFEDKRGGTREVINVAFEVPGELPTRVSLPGTEIVLAFSERPTYGFYNRGLTLALTEAVESVLDQRAARFAHIAVKIKSRYLEHTLSRETVLRDDNYEKAMRLLEEAADGALLEKLFDRLERLTAQATWSVGQFHEYGRLSWYLSREPPSSLVKAAPRLILRTVDGRALSPAEVVEALRRDGRVLLSDAVSELTELLRSQGVPVLLGRVEPAGDEDASPSPGRPLDAIRGVVRRALAGTSSTSWQSKMSALLWSLDVELGGASEVVLAAPEDVYVPVRIDEAPAPEVRRLVDHAARLLAATRSGYRRLTTCTLSAPVDDTPLFVVGRTLSIIMAQPPAHLSNRRPLEKLEAAVNTTHPQFTALFELAKSAPELAAYCLAKDLLLSEDRLLENDLALMSAALSTNLEGRG